MTSEKNDPNRRVTLTRQHYFPTLIYFQDIVGAAALNEHVRNNIYAWRDLDADGIQRSGASEAGCWHSDTDMHTRPEFSELVNQVLGAAQALFDDLNYDVSFPAAIDNMWANINPPGGYNRPHIHPNVLWSGVYFVQAPADSGNLTFTDPRPQAQMIVPRYAANGQLPAEVWNEVFYEPVEGRMILFPAWLMHEVHPNRSNNEGSAGDRIGVSFNLIQSSTVGE